MPKKPKRKKAISAPKSRTLLLRRMYIAMASISLLGIVYFFAFADALDIRSEKYFFLVPKNMTQQAFLDTLTNREVLKHNWTFRLMCRIMSFKTPHPGLHALYRTWGNLHLISYLQNNIPEPHRSLRVRSYRNRSRIIRDICSQTNTDFKGFYATLNDSLFLKKHGLDKESVFCLFYPGELVVFKHASPKQLVEVLEAYFMNYWTEERREKAYDAGLSPVQATILATIVYSETKSVIEMPLIAGVYLNRLKKGMRLESDPTLVFAKGDFKIRRIYHKYTLKRSDYNTYRKKGLPPGPVGEINYAALNAVLNYTDHDFLFFCANDDFSGTHVYAENYDRHLQNATRYRNRLNKKKIR